jgi:hypothetical protein
MMEPRRGDRRAGEKPMRELLDNISREWLGNPPASASVIAALSAWWAAPLPAEYLRFLRLSDGGQGDFDGYPTYIRFWSAGTVVENNDDYQIQRNAPGLLGIGDNGGLDIVAFNICGPEPWPLVAVPFAPMELASAIPVAPSFAELLARLRRK